MPQKNIEYTPEAGRQVIAYARNYWGRGDTTAEALKKLRGAGARRGAKTILYDVPAGTVVNDMGSFTYWPPEGKSWPELEAETGKTPPEWAAIRPIAAGKVGSSKLTPPPPAEY